MSGPDRVDFSKLKSTLRPLYRTGKWGELSYWSYLTKVSESAEKVAKNYTVPYDEPRLPEHIEQIETCTAAALCSELVERHSYSFEKLTDLAGYRVAEVVCSYSGDMRLPATKRMEERISRLQHGDWKSQVVELACLLVQVESMQEQLWATKEHAEVQNIRYWIQAAEKRLKAVIRLTDVPTLKSYFKWLTAKLGQLHDGCKDATERIREAEAYNKLANNIVRRRKLEEDAQQAQRG